MKKRREAGFTLIELILVVGILALLLTITLIALNPSRIFSQGNNTKRSSDVNAILQAISQYETDNRGSLPGNFSSCTISTPCTLTNDSSVAVRIDICAQLTPTYLAAFPEDPKINNGAAITNCGVTYNSGYAVSKSATDNRITISAPEVELNASIAVTR